MKGIPTEEGLPINLESIDILMIISPKSRIGDTHRNSIIEYIGSGGKAFIAIEPILIDYNQWAGISNRDSAADLILSEFGISIESDLVFDIQSNEPIALDGGAGSVLRSYPYWVKADVVDPKIGGEVQSVVIPWASTLGILNLPDSPFTVSPLISTTEYAYIDMDMRNLRTNSPAFFQVSPDNQVLSDLAVALEHRNGSRLIITGDADWIADGTVRNVRNSADNFLLALNLVDWLAQEDNLASVRTKIISERNLVFSSDRHRNIVRYANIAGVPIAFVLLGLVRFMQRRSKGFRNRWAVGSNGKNGDPKRPGDSANEK